MHFRNANNCGLRLNQVPDGRRANRHAQTHCGKENPHLNVGMADDLQFQAKNASLDVIQAGHWPQVDLASDVARTMEGQ